MPTAIAATIRGSFQAAIGVVGEGDISVLIFPRGALANQVPQASEVFGACWASFEMRPHTGHLPVCVELTDAELHVAVEMAKALLAGQLRTGRPKQTRQEFVVL